VGKVAVFGLLDKQISLMKAKHPGVAFVGKGAVKQIPRGCDLLVFARFVSHSEIHNAKRCNPAARCAFHKGGLTAMSRTIRKEEDDVSA
jgi:hypothetical protein